MDTRVPLATAVALTPTTPLAENAEQASYTLDIDLCSRALLLMPHHLPLHQGL